MDALVAHFGKAAKQLPMGGVSVTPS